MGVSVTSSTMQAAASLSNNDLRGKDYNLNFANNDYLTGNLNCSQLVWVAHTQYGVDRDGNGGLGVYPYNLRDSNLTYTYSTSS